jgi:hypothetical protein
LKQEWHPLHAFHQLLVQCPARPSQFCFENSNRSHCWSRSSHSKSCIISCFGRWADLWWSLFMRGRTLCCITTPVFHDSHCNFALAARLSYFVWVFFRDSSRAADAALLVFHFDPSEFSAIDHSERISARVVLKHFPSLSNQSYFAFRSLLSSW